jgi:hypothetical protein
MTEVLRFDLKLDFLQVLCSVFVKHLQNVVLIISEHDALSHIEGRLFLGLFLLL